MKIYLVHEISIDVEDTYDHIYGAYTSYDKAQRTFERLRCVEAERRMQAEKCNECPLKNYSLSNENMIRAAEKYCECAKIKQHEDDSLFCDNEDDNFTWYDYTIQELEVDESKE